MKLKEIHIFLTNLVEKLLEKERSQSETNLPLANKEYTKGQLYEARYILDQVESIIYEDK